MSKVHKIPLKLPSFIPIIVKLLNFSIKLQIFLPLFFDFPILAKFPWSKSSHFNDFHTSKGHPSKTADKRQARSIFPLSTDFKIAFCQIYTGH